MPESGQFLPVLKPVAPQRVDDCLAQIAAAREAMPKRLRQCADFVIKFSDRIAVSTVADVAVGADVPPSAVMRFCQVIGFSGFSEMQRLFRDDYSPKWPDYSTRLANLKSGRAGSPSLLLAEFIEAGRLSLENLAKTVDEAAMLRAGTLLSKADTIHIIGLRRAFPVASYFAYALEKMNVSCILHGGMGMLDHRHALRPGDALLAITFAPYSQESLDLAAYAHAQGVPVLALTDDLSSPLVRYASTVLTLEEVDFGAFRALSATLALAMALAVAVGTARGE